MRINHEREFIFVHVPHTGGTSVRDFLNQSVGTEKYKHKHAPAKEIEDKFSSYTTFSIARSHIDWLHSGYRYCQRKDGRRWFPKCFEFAKDHSFKEYVKWYLSHDVENIRREHSPQFIPRYLGFFYYMGKNCQDVDYVVWHGKNGFENLKTVLKKVVGVDAGSFPHKNKNVEDRSSIRYEPETRKLVEQHYEDEIQHFKQNVCQ